MNMFVHRMFSSVTECMGVCMCVCASSVFKTNARMMMMMMTAMQNPPKMLVVNFKKYLGRSIGWCGKILNSKENKSNTHH